VCPLALGCWLGVPRAVAWRARLSRSQQRLAGRGGAGRGRQGRLVACENCLSAWLGLGLGLVTAAVCDCGRARAGRGRTADGLRAATTFGQWRGDRSAGGLLVVGAAGGDATVVRRGQVQPRTRRLVVRLSVGLCIPSTGTHVRIEARTGCGHAYRLRPETSILNAREPAPSYRKNDFQSHGACVVSSWAASYLLFRGLGFSWAGECLSRLFQQAFFNYSSPF